MVNRAAASLKKRSRIEKKTILESTSPVQRTLGFTCLHPQAKGESTLRDVIVIKNSDTPVHNNNG